MGTATLGCVDAAGALGEDGIGGFRLSLQMRTNTVMRKRKFAIESNKVTPMNISIVSEVRPSSSCAMAAKPCATRSKNTSLNLVANMLFCLL